MTWKASRDQAKLIKRSPASRVAFPKLVRIRVAFAGGSILALCSVAWILAGCSSHADRLVEARSHYFRGDIAQAEQSIKESIEDKPKEEDVLKLDQAMVLLSSGRNGDAEDLLRQVRDRFDHLQQASIGEEAASFLTDETARAYSGEEYERILIPIMLALTSLTGDGYDATAYAHQIAAIQQDHEQPNDVSDGDESPPFEPHLHLAIGPYLQGVLAEATHRGYDDAERYYAQAVSWQPTFDAGIADIERVRHGYHSQRDHGVVYIFAFVGRGPYKEVVNEIPSSQALLVADRILSATGKHTLPPTIAPIKVPKVVRAPNTIDRVVVRVDGQSVGHTTTLTDITAMAVAQNESEFTEIVGRAVARRVVKKAVVYTAKEVTTFSDNALLNLAMDAAGVAWEATETADTRCWGLLPDTIQVLRVELPVGYHQLDLTPASGTGPKGGSESLSVNVENGRNTYVLANFPGERLTGTILHATH